MINKTRILIYKNHLETLSLYLASIVSFWTTPNDKTGEPAINESYIDELIESIKEVDRQLEELKEFEVTISARQKAHEDFGRLILMDTQNIRMLSKEKFPKEFVLGSLSTPYILDSMNKVNQEVRKLSKNNVEVSLIKDHLNNYLELVKKIVNPEE